LSVTDQEIIAQAIRQVQQILAVQVAPGYRDPEEAVTKLLKVLSRQDLVDALHRVEQGFGLRLVQ
jgi:hypothetical protein